MQLCKVQWETGEVRVGAVADGHVRFLDLEDFVGMRSLSDVLHSDNPPAVARDLIDESARTWSLKDLTLLAPVDRQEVWAAGVTYKRSKVAREEESASTGGSRFYDMVYTAPRPELFFKAPARRVVHPGVPEPEVALIVSPTLKIAGYTIGNDMSSRDIEGENPLYLPQAKFYDGACTVGPVITLAGFLPPLAEVGIRLSITRDGAVAFEGSTTLAQMARSFEELVSWLGRETSFPDGAVLLTGTGIVPPDSFTLAAGDEVVIEVAGIGKLASRVIT